MLLNAVLLLAVLFIALICLVLALRCLGVDELSLAGRRVSLALPAPCAGETFTASMGLKAALWGLWALLAYYGLGVMLCALRNDSVTRALLRSMWQQWDANNFLRIAQVGYGGYEVDGMHTTLVFFPLYPWLMRPLHLVLQDWNLCGHVLSSICFVCSCWVVARLVTEDFGWHTATLALTLLAAYPFAFFFAGIYSESLFLLTSAAAFYCIRRHRWVMAGVLSALAALTRMQGVFLTLAGLAEYCAAEKPVEKLRARDWRGLWHDAWRKLLPLAIALAGPAIYLWVNWRVDGDPFQFIKYERAIWSQGFAPLPACLTTIWNNFSSRWGQKLMFTIWGPDLVVFGASLAALGYALRRMPLAWTAYLLACVLLNYSLSWPLSCGRYMACAFPLFAALALACRTRPAAGPLLAGGCALVQTALLFVYLSGGQVM